MRFAKGAIGLYDAAIHLSETVTTIMIDTTRQPDGELLLRTLAMPADTNANGDIFGGWIMSQMDIGGGILAKELAKGRICTVSVEGMTFHNPIKVGDVVCCYGRCQRIGRSSMQIKLEVWVKPVLRENEAQRYCVTEGVFNYVAIDDNGRPRPVPALNA
ncbi:acyl-CoA thioesterase YciA [Aeromonas sp. RU39B]|jgi:acyl-CoA thioesterase YciA|nr:acyl-CoA thioesterase YciA [Aeromonas sp. RU39B]